MKRLTMRKIREALRLHASGLSTRKIATSLGVGQSTANEYLKRIERAALTWFVLNNLHPTVFNQQKAVFVRFSSQHLV